MSNLAMFCHQCSMAQTGGCGSSGKTQGTCGKDDTLSRLQDIMIFGLKGLSAYRTHANDLGAATKSVDDVIAETLYFTLTNVNFSFDQHIAQLMKVGAAGSEIMSRLGEAHHQRLGVPTPVCVPQNKAEGKGILVTGHDLELLERLLIATEGTGINIYTHSEMLPAHGYPELRKYPHLKGNIGKAWFDQKQLFQKWNGTIIVTTNCIVPLTGRADYADRLYRYGIVGIDGCRQLGEDFAPLIEHTLSLPDIEGFDSDETLTTGHNYKTILGLAPQILDAVNSGKIKQFFVVAGCDKPGKQNDYYRDLALSIPQDCIILTSSCGKFRFNDHDFGTIPGTEIPRYIDLGQCNDSYGAVMIALALSDAMGVPVNDLPVNIVLSWMEQKAVLILLALFNLGIQNIYLGPNPPEFVNEAIFEFLQQQFNLKLTSDVKTDLDAMLNPQPTLSVVDA
ncbi:hydroxylamine reductase [Photobacterium sp. GSS17]|uniref:hydroxylamine reductase n=1 Tax=Photobacterium TaxID=657 RepID=UPI002360DE1C|nr:hydroxylamine reductase [Photobacterium sp. GSS17]